MKDTKEKPNKDELERAVKVVREAIREQELLYEELASKDDQSPVMVEGATKTGYYCQIMVDPKDAARIMLDYNYPTWKVLEEDSPTEMWSSLADLYGLESVSSIDL